MNTLQKLQKYMGNRKILLTKQLTTSILSKILNLLILFFFPPKLFQKKLY